MASFTEEQGVGLGLFEKACYFRFIAEINLEGADSIGARIACSLDIPAPQPKRSRDFATQEASSASDEDGSLRHCD